jgi:hypothetical protein
MYRNLLKNDASALAIGEGEGEGEEAAAWKSDEQDGLR